MALTLAAVLALACGRQAVPRDGDGLDVSGQSRQFQEDYALFANRCSKCHALARPLNLASQQKSEAFWESYVDRMRRQPGSGISVEDGRVVRRFLREYTRLQYPGRRESDAKPEAPPPATDAADDGGRP